MSSNCSRAAFLTGRYPFRYGMGSEALELAAPIGLDENEELLPKFLKGGGYSTHMIGKWHLGLCKKAFEPTSRGFDTFFGNYMGQINYFTHEVSNNITDYFNDTKAVLQKSYCGTDWTNEGKC